MRKLRTLAVLTFTVLVLPGAGRATSLLFTGSSGSLDASVDFSLVSSDLVVTLTNTSLADVLVPTDVLTAVFFDVAGDPTFSRISAVVPAGSTVLYGTTDPGGVVGGEWAYNNGLAGTPGGATQGISSVGVGLFGPSNLFPGTNLQGPVSPDGLQYGITSAGDNPLTGNAAVTGQFALIRNSVLLTLGNLPGGFKLSSISNVWFLYGTSLTGPQFQGSQVPPSAPTAEPTTLLLIGGGLVLMARLKKLVRIFKKS